MDFLSQNLVTYPNPQRRDDDRTIPQTLDAPICPHCCLSVAFQIAPR